VAVFEGVAGARVASFPQSGSSSPTDHGLWVFTIDRVLSGPLGGRTVEVISPPMLPTDPQGRFIFAFTTGERYRIRGILNNTPAGYLRPLCAEAVPPEEGQARAYIDPLPAPTTAPTKAPAAMPERVRKPTPAPAPTTPATMPERGAGARWITLTFLA
jgi:hypothetical protein